MAITLSLPCRSASSIYPIPFSSFSSLPNQIPTNPESSILSSAAISSSSKLQFIIPHHSTTIVKHPLLLITDFDRPYVDTQSVLVTISVLVAISLSLFLGLKVNKLNSSIFLWVSCKLFLKKLKILGLYCFFHS